MEHEILTSEQLRLPKKERTPVAEFFNSVFFSPLFYIPLFLKIIAGYFLASHFATDLFIPFIQYFIAHPLDNSYQHFYEMGKLSSFPYPFGMLLSVSASYAFFGIFISGIQTTLQHVDLILLRIPLLVADVGILFVLVTWFKRFKKEILILYWASPILFYISYIHGQLDVIPVFFLFMFLYFLTKERDYIAFIFLGLAIATKTGMVIIVPFVALYLLKERKNIALSFVKILLPFVVFFIINIHVVFTKGFIEMVFKTKEGFKVFDLSLMYNQDLVLYIVPCIILLLLFSFAMFKRYSRDVLMTFLGFSFFVLLLCIPPRQGWYFWVIPFAVYFYAQKPWRSWVPLYLLTFMYFFYFAIIKDSDFLSVFLPSFSSLGSLPTLNDYLEGIGISTRTIVPLVFTLLQGALLLNIYVIYKNGISLYTKQKLYYRPFLLGIAGDSGSGKTTLAELLANVFSINNTTVIAGDDMHKWERGNDKWQEYTHLDPLANDLHADINNVYTIKCGNPIMRKQYDHSTGTFADQKMYEAKRLVIFEGLHSFFLDNVRKAFDVKIYIAPEDQLRLHWKILRDEEKRGHTKEQTLAILERRKDDSEKFIRVQEKHSDIVISLRNDVSLGTSLGQKGVELSMSLFISCANGVYLEPLLRELSPYFSIDYLIHDEKQRIKFSGTLDANAVEVIASNLLPELDNLSSKEPVWAGGYQGVIQLFVTFYMFQVLASEEYER